MENLIATSLFVFICYAVLFVPKKKVIVTPITSEITTDIASKDDTKKELIIERLPESEFQKPLASKENKKDFNLMTIRELKKLASVAKIKGYGNLRKKELIKALS